MLWKSNNILWTAWGIQVDAAALIAMQVGLALMNIGGAMKTGFARDEKSASSLLSPADKSSLRQASC